MVAAQVREDRRVDAHTVDASLRQCVRRDLDGRIAGALFNKPREAFLHFDHGRGRHALAALQFAKPVTQGAQIGASLEHALDGLDDDGMLAIVGTPTSPGGVPVEASHAMAETPDSSASARKSRPCDVRP